MTLFADLETFSPVPISHGTWAYAEQAEVMLCTYAIDDGPVQVLDFHDGPILAAVQSLIDAHDKTVWQNGGNFDRVVLKHVGVTLPVEKIHDTMVQAMAHSLPGSLAKVGKVLGVPQNLAKLDEGKALINLFCKPRPKKQKLRRATRATHPQEWAEFVEYAKQDIEATRFIYGKLPSWNYRNGELKLWHIDQRINDRGVAVDLELAHAAIESAARVQDVLAEETVRLTDGEVKAATQRDAMLLHILNTYGIQLPDLKGSTVDDMLTRVADLPDALRELLVVRVQASKTSTTKYKRLVQATSADGRLRGLLQFCGATRTGRWAGRTFQPQNLQRIPKHIKKQYDHAIAAVKADAVDLIFDSPMEVLGSVVRGALVAAPGKKFCIADLSNIEGRMLAWLSHEEWKLQAFRDYDTIIGHDEEGEPIRKGADLYKLAYAKAFGIRVEDVDDFMRQIGKVLELALGYQGGVGAFITFAAAYGIDLEDMAEKAWPTIPEDTKAAARDFMEWRYGETRGTKAQFYIDKGATIAVARIEAEKKRAEVRFGLSEQAFIVCDSFKRLWRAAHTNTAAWWKELEEAARRAVLSPGITVPARSVKFRKDGSWLRCLLPSGRYLCYPFPQVAEGGNCKACRGTGKVLDEMTKKETEVTCPHCKGVGREKGGQVSFMGVNQFNRQWCRIKTYGGKLAENITQASARDVFAHAMPLLEEAGYPIVLGVHDENITETPDEEQYSSNEVARIMSTVPAWCAGLPLAAAGFETYRYRKE